MQKKKKKKKKKICIFGMLLLMLSVFYTIWHWWIFEVGLRRLASPSENRGTTAKQPRKFPMPLRGTSADLKILLCYICFLLLLFSFFLVVSFGIDKILMKKLTFSGSSRKISLKGWTISLDLSASAFLRSFLGMEVLVNVSKMMNFWPTV